MCGFLWLCVGGGLLRVQALVKGISLLRMSGQGVLLLCRHLWKEDLKRHLGAWASDVHLGGATLEISISAPSAGPAKQYTALGC